MRVTRPYLGETVQQYAWIDLSPMDGMPKNKVMYKIWVKYLLLRRAIHSFAKFGDRTIDDIKSRIKNPVVRFAYQMFYKLKLYRLFDERKETRKLDRACARFSDGKEAYYANVMGGSNDKDIFPVEVYAEGVELPFEDIKIRCPKNYEVYLTQTYGADYMSPPPEDKRDRHHILDIEFLK